MKKPLILFLVGSIVSVVEQSPFVSAAPTASPSPSASARSVSAPSVGTAQGLVKGPAQGMAGTYLVEFPKGTNVAVRDVVVLQRNGVAIGEAMVIAVKESTATIVPKASMKLQPMRGDVVAFERHAPEPVAVTRRAPAAPPRTIPMANDDERDSADAGQDNAIIGVQASMLNEHGDEIAVARMTAYLMEFNISFGHRAFTAVSNDDGIFAFKIAPNSASYYYLIGTYTYEYQVLVTADNGSFWQTRKTLISWHQRIPSVGSGKWGIRLTSSNKDTRYDPATEPDYNHPGHLPFGYGRDADLFRL